MLRPRHIACAVALALASSAAFAQSAPVPVQPAATHAGLFDNMVAFGDSLSDDGNFTQILTGQPTSKFTTNPGLVTVENISATFGFPMSNSLSGGNDFAVGGAGMNNSEIAFVPVIPTQLQGYLAANGGAANPNTLYSMWGGANDIFYLTDPANHVPQDQVAPATQAAAVTEIGLLKSLAGAGARYVMVFNLPDMGKTPAAIAAGPQAQAALSQLSVLYNSTLDSGLGQLSSAGLNIIPVNVYGMFNLLLADPARYGLTNVTDTACTGGVTSLPWLCGPEGSSFPYTYKPGTENTYLFANAVHPTTGAHALLAQYAESIVIAPGEMSLLTEAPLQVSQALNHSIMNQATTSLASAPGNGLRVWAAYDYAHQSLDAQVNTPSSSNNVNTLSIGADIHPSDTVTAGLAFTAGQQKDNFGGNAGGFKVRDLLATGYVMFGWQRGYFGAVGSFGHLGYDDIHRNIPIGPTMLYEGGSTSGSHLGFALTGGWWINMGDWRTGPYGELSWQHIHVDGFSENGNDAAAMTFDRQDRHALIGTFGWQVTGNVQAGNTVLHPFAKVAWNHDDDADQHNVMAGLVSMPGTFAMPGFIPDKNWGSVGLGLAADFTPAFSGWVGYDGRYSDSTQSLNSLNLGVKFKF